MLNYQSGAFHDGAALRHTLGKKPAPEFHAWAQEMGFLDADGRLAERAGDLSIFLGK